MKVVILKNNDKLGKVGDVKEVANGYAINFLIPQKLALPATQKNIDLTKKKQVQEEQVVVKKVKDTKKLVEMLRSFTLALRGKADDTGTLFAGINKNTLVKELGKKGIGLKTKQVDLDEPIKSFGEHKVGINLDKGMKVYIKVNVSKE